MGKNYPAYIRAYLKRLSALEPNPAGMAGRLSPLPGIRAVLFNIYGTLLISASGDVDIGELREEAALESLKEAPVSFETKASGTIGRTAIELYVEEIHARHEALRAEGIAHPEVDIVETWKRIIGKMESRKLLGLLPNTDIRRCAFVFEMLCNPVYPMPGMLTVLRTLGERGLRLGIVSNAQFFTPIVLNYFITGGITLGEEVALFDPRLTFYSFTHHRAKPDPYLFELARRELRRYAITPEQTAYLGNDMLNDVWAGGSAGFKTVLFAGDGRSLRLREDSKETENLEPDSVITALPELLSII